MHINQGGDLARCRFFLIMRRVFMTSQTGLTTGHSLQAFLAHPPSYENMPYPDLTPAQVTDIISYILTVRGSH